MSVKMTRQSRDHVYFDFKAEVSFFFKSFYRREYVVDLKRG